MFMDNRYRSTRGSVQRLNFCESVLQGIGTDGGLLVPDFELPLLNLESLQGLGYVELATEVLSRFAPELSREALAEACTKAYASGTFPPDVVPVVSAGDIYVAELYHGPTAAFKDMALQLLPHLMGLSLNQKRDGQRALILAATSGDTGKAALEGFHDVEGTFIKVFYPVDGVSVVQRQQMITQSGNNVEVVAIRGNFDDAQRAVKEAFASSELQEACSRKGIFLSSANSINIGRLAPQVVYYFHAYLQLVKKGTVKMGEKINFVVPSGNFGNCLAGVIARSMGLPVARFIVASNRNNVLTDFFSTGAYDVRRPFYKTNAPAMDILVSSNLERLLFMLCGDSGKVAEWMQLLKDERAYSVDDAMRDILQESFSVGWLSEDEVLDTIGHWFRQYGYLADTHTAVGLGVYERYRCKTGDSTPAVVLSTASPYKFPASVCRAVTGEILSDEKATASLMKLSGIAVPDCLNGVMERPVLHRQVIDPCHIVSFIKDGLTNL